LQYAEAIAKTVVPNLTTFTPGLDETWERVQLNGVLTKAGGNLITPAQVVQEVANLLPALSDLMKLLPTQPRWMASQTRLTESLHASMVWSFRTKADADKFKLLVNHAPLFGYCCRLSDYKERKHIIQCLKCNSLTHTITFCPAKSARCALCAGPHYTSQHDCYECEKDGGGCEHLPFKCCNCQGNHPATSMECPKRKRLQASSRTTQRFVPTSRTPPNPQGGRQMPKQKSSAANIKASAAESQKAAKPKSQSDTTEGAQPQVEEPMELDTPDQNSQPVASTSHD
jgi:hypothetical protein